MGMLQRMRMRTDSQARCVPLDYFLFFFSHSVFSTPYAFSFFCFFSLLVAPFLAADVPLFLLCLQATDLQGG